MKKIYNSLQLWLWTLTPLIASAFVVRLTLAISAYPDPDETKMIYRLAPVAVAFLFLTLVSSVVRGILIRRAATSLSAQARGAHDCFWRIGWSIIAVILYIIPSASLFLPTSTLGMLYKR